MSEESKSLSKFARRHRVETGFLVAALFGVVMGLTKAPLWAVLLVEAPLVMVGVPWIVMGRRGE